MDLAAVYEDLADLEEQRGATQNRDRFLILAADAALTHGDSDRAEELRDRLLQSNPHHLLRPYPSLADALRSPDVFSYVVDLRRTYPPEEAERLLESMRSGSSVPEAAEKFPAPEIDAQTVDESTEGPAEPEIYPLTRAAAREPSPAVEEPAVPSSATSPPARADRPASRIAVATPPPEPGAAFPLPSRPQPLSERTESGSAVSAWVSTFLSALLLGAAVGLMVYTFGRPFLQR